MPDEGGSGTVLLQPKVQDVVVSVDTTFANYFTALQDYEGRTKNYAFELEKRISEFAGTAINVTTWFRYYSFDVMGDFTFGHSFDMLKDGESHFAVDMLREGMAPIGPFTPVPWLFVIMKSIPGLTRGWNRMLTWCYEQLTLRLKVLHFSNCSSMCTLY